MVTSQRMKKVKKGWEREQNEVEIHKTTVRDDSLIHKQINHQYCNQIKQQILLMSPLDNG